MSAPKVILQIYYLKKSRKPDEMMLYPYALSVCESSRFLLNILLCKYDPNLESDSIPSRYMLSLSETCFLHKIIKLISEMMSFKFTLIFHCASLVLFSFRPCLYGESSLRYPRLFLQVIDWHPMQTYAVLILRLSVYYR